MRRKCIVQLNRFCKTQRAGRVDAFLCETQTITASDLITSLKQCCTTRDLAIGKRIHQNVTEHHPQPSLIITNTLLNMYCKCGSLALAEQVFDQTAFKDVTTWNCLIHGLVNSGEYVTALSTFESMDCSPDDITFVAAIKAYTALASHKSHGKVAVLQKGKAIHEQLQEHGHATSCFVSNCLINMYSRCGDMQLAKNVFDRMGLKDVVTWTSLIQGYVENGQCAIAFAIFNTMDCDPDVVTCIAVIKACAALKVESALLVHQKTKECSLDSSVVVSSALVDMYSKLREMKMARLVFESLTLKNVIAWTCLIQGYVENGESSTALELFYRMSCAPDEVTYVAALRACSGVASATRSKILDVLQKGLAIHEQVKRSGLASNVVLASALMNMYAKCERMDLAQQVFNGISKKDTAAWTCLIYGYADNKSWLAALDAFSRMDCKPDRVTYIAVFKALSGLAGEESQGVLERALLLHEEVRKAGLERDILLSNALVDLYSRCKMMHLARDVFERMIRKDTVTWNSIIQGYVTNRKSSVALELFHSMDCEADDITFVAALRACACLASQKESERAGALEKGIAIHENVKGRGAASNIVVGNTLIDMYSKCGKIDSAKDVFDRMLNKDVVTWTSLMLGYVENGKSSVALALFENMNLEPDSVTYISVIKACTTLASQVAAEKQMIIEKGVEFHQQIRERGFLSSTGLANAVLDMYRRFGCTDSARDVFHCMKQKDVATWTSLILGYVESGECRQAIEIFNRMDCKPDRITYVAALSACGGMADLPLGRRTHAFICRHGLERDYVVGTALLDMYGSGCGCTARALEVFCAMHSPDVVSWNALIAGYSSVADSARMFDAVRKMRESGLRLDSVTFVSILAACSHAGMVDEGQVYFRAMKEHLVNPTLSHYNCMIDMLGRANRLSEAALLVNAMPFKSNEVTWTSLIGEAGKVAYDDNQVISLCVSKDKT